MKDSRETAVISEALSVIDKARGEMLQRATTVAMLNQSAITGPVDQPVSTTAAKNAELACPLGKLEVRGLRILNRASPLTVGRWRLKKGLMPWLSSKLSIPISDERISA